MLSILLNPVAYGIAALAIGTGGLTLLVCVGLGRSKSDRQLAWCIFAFGMVLGVPNAIHTFRPADKGTTVAFKLDAPGCVVRGPDGQRIVLAGKPGADILIPRGSTITGECFDWKLPV